MRRHVEKQDRLVPSWKINPYGLTNVFQGYLVKAFEPVEDITLTPLGATCLDISTFLHVD